MSENLKRAIAYWADEVKFQAQSVGKELDDGEAEEIAEELIYNSDYMWGVINDTIAELL